MPRRRYLLQQISPAGISSWTGVVVVLIGAVSHECRRNEAPGLTRIRSRALVLSIGLLIRDPCDCLWYFSQSRISLCLQNEVVLHSAGVIQAVCRMVRLSDFGSMRVRNGYNLWIRIRRFEDTKVFVVGITSRFVDCTMVVIQSGLTILAQPREATHTAQRMEVAAVAFGLNGISPEMANPLFRRSLRPVMRGPAWETGRVHVADPVAKSVRSRVP